MKELESFRGHKKDVTCKLSNYVMIISSYVWNQSLYTSSVSVHWLGLMYMFWKYYYYTYSFVNITWWFSIAFFDIFYLQLFLIKSCRILLKLWRGIQFMKNTLSVGALTDPFVIGLSGRFCCNAICYYSYPFMLLLLWSFIRIYQIMFLVYILYPIMTHVHASRIFLNLLFRGLVFV